MSKRPLTFPVPTGGWKALRAFLLMEKETVIFDLENGTIERVPAGAKYVEESDDGSIRIEVAASWDGVSDEALAGVVDTQK